MGRKGFTLFELMLMILLVGIVSATFIPVLVDAHETAISTQCKSNLHQIAVLCQHYAVNEGFFPWGSVDPGKHEVGKRGETVALSARESG